MMRPLSLYVSLNLKTSILRRCQQIWRRIDWGRFHLHHAAKAHKGHG